MDRQSNLYTFIFALIICIVCSLALSSVFEGLRTQRELNVVLDIKKNILKAVNLKQPLPKDASAEVIQEIYDSSIEEIVVDEEGNVIEGKKPADIAEGENLHPLYIYKDGGQTVAYCIPIVGKGLWSTLYGYFAIEPDAITVRGITYYKHGETPGLGAEIETDWFQNNFKGKKIYDVKTHELDPTKVVKGKVADKISKENAPFYVDGISGATMTSKGVTAMIDKWVRIYDPYFQEIRKQ